MDSIPKRVSSSHRQDLLDALQDIIKDIERHKIRIRNLEKRQEFIDDCIEKMIAFRNSENRICAYDERILDFGLSYESEEIPPEIPDEDGLPSTLCRYQGRCPMHDGWDLIKSREVALELEEEIRLYKQGKYREMELLIQLSDRKQLQVVQKLIY
jgi:hypothetical protein